MGNIGLKALQIKFSGNRHTIIGMIDLKGIFEFMCKTKLDGDIHIHTLAEKEYFHQKKMEDHGFDFDKKPKKNKYPRQQKISEEYD